MVETSEYKDFSLRGRASTIALQHLRYVVAAAEYGSFRRAAEALLLQQSTLSRRILQLEESIGVTVFERSSGGVRATPAGRDFLRIARSILEQMDAPVTTARNTGRGEADWPSDSIHRCRLGICVGRSSISDSGFRRSKLAWLKDPGHVLSPRCETAH